MTRAAFYCVCDARYFLGAVGMINSLRLQGHREPIYLLDLGLSAEQRELLGGEVSFVEAPAGIPPWLAKTIAPLRHPAETMVLIDADMIVTRPLTELIERAAAGRVVAFENDESRFFSEWGQLLGIGTVEPRPYLCSGLVFAGGRFGAEVLSGLDRGQGVVEIERTYYGRDEPGYPFRHPEQDVLNALLGAAPEERAVRLPFRLAPMPPFTGLEVADERRLRCRYPDGTEPFVVHHYVVKPWLERTHEGVYSRLLRRALAGPDLAIELPARRVPHRLRYGIGPLLERRAIDLGFRFKWHLVQPVTARLQASSRR